MATNTKNKPKQSRQPLKVCYLSPNVLTPFGRNSRTHSDEQIAQIVASINEFGFTNPILIDEKNGIIAGHGRLLAAEAVGLEEIPTITLTGLTDAQRRAYVIADNKLALNAGWDDVMLREELTILELDDFDLSVIGFDDDELLTILVDDDADEDDDDIPPIVENPISKIGDVWLLGNHRLVCGDSISKADVKILMDGQKADMVFTDPPYNVDYSGRGQNNLGKIKNDAMTSDEFIAFCDGFMKRYYELLKPLGVIYICHPDSASAPKIAFETTFEKYFKKSSTIIWAKQSAGMGWQDYRAQHEPILYGWKEGTGKHYFCDDRSKTTLWNISRDNQASYIHPTQKPVALSLEAVQNSSKCNSTVVDLFGGSGSTLIACEKTKRKCFMMELDPTYVDVIIQRWQNYTGLTATLDGVSYDELETKRAS